MTRTNSELVCPIGPPGPPKPIALVYVFDSTGSGPSVPRTSKWRTFPTPTQGARMLDSSPASAPGELVSSIGPSLPSDTSAGIVASTRGGLMDASGGGGDDASGSHGSTPQRGAGLVPAPSGAAS